MSPLIGPSIPTPMSPVLRGLLTSISTLLSVSPREGNDSDDNNSIGSSLGNSINNGSSELVNEIGNECKFCSNKFNCSSGDTNDSSRGVTSSAGD